MAEVIRIEWPSGTVQELRAVPADRVMSVTEPPALAVVGPGQLLLRGWKGQPFTLESSPDLRQWSALGTVTTQANPTEYTTPFTGEPSRFYRARSQ